MLAGSVNPGFIMFSGRELQVDWRGAFLLDYGVVRRIGRQLSRDFLNVAVITFCTKAPGAAVSLRIKLGDVGYGVVSLASATGFVLVKGSN